MFSRYEALNSAANIIANKRKKKKRGPLKLKCEGKLIERLRIKLRTLCKT